MVLRINTILSNRYEIVGKIGSGGMSDVYKAVDKKLNRLVAIKVLKDEYASDADFVSKFRMEAQSAACLSNPNIVNIYDVGEDKGIYFIVMELIEGITLKKYIDRRGKLGIREAIEVALQVSYGLEAAHSEHIIHRDIKPQNIMISKEGKVFVSDFGIARATISENIGSSTMGSAHYISPEQARGGYTDERSDIYSLGITMYEMLTGRVPFEGDSEVAVALLHIQGEMVPPSQYEPLIPISLEKIILKCTQKNPEDRYLSASELIADLKKALTSPNEDFVSIGAAGVAATAAAAAIASASKKDGPSAMNIASRKSLVDDNDYSEDDLDPDDEDLDEFEEEDEKDKKFEKIVTYLGIGVAVVIVGLLIAAFFYACGNNLFSSDNQVEMIDLRGKTYEEATAELTKLGLKIKATYGESDKYLEGQIYEQDVADGSKVTVGTVINVKIAGGAKMITVPSDLEGFSPDVVKATLSSVGFTNISDTYKEEESNDVAEGKVIRTEPKSGSSVAADTEIVIVVSKGGSKVTVPDLSGMSLNQAKSALTSAGLYVGEVSYKESSSSMNGLIVSQGISAGNTAARGSAINVVIGTGPSTTASPTTETSSTASPTKPTTPTSDTAPSSSQQTDQYGDAVE